jgi:hypothetical protein
LPQEQQEEEQWYTDVWSGNKWIPRHVKTASIEGKYWKCWDRPEGHVQSLIQAHCQPSEVFCYYPSAIMVQYTYLTC